MSIVFSPSFKNCPSLLSLASCIRDLVDPGQSARFPNYACYQNDIPGRAGVSGTAVAWKWKLPYRITATHQLRIDIHGALGDVLLVSSPRVNSVSKPPQNELLASDVDVRHVNVIDYPVHELGLRQTNLRQSESFPPTTLTADSHGKPIGRRCTNKLSPD